MCHTWGDHPRSDSLSRPSSCGSFHSLHKYTNAQRERERKREGEREREIDREIDRETERSTDRQIDR